MRWFLALVLGVVVVLGAVPARAAVQAGPRADAVAPPSALVLVERLTDEALAAVGPGVPVGGFVSTLPVHQPLASRVLSLAAGRRVDALDALEADPAAAGQGLPGPATVARIRADNPGARFGRLPPRPGCSPTPGWSMGCSRSAQRPGPPPGPLGPGDQRIPCVRDSCWSWPCPTRPPWPTWPAAWCRPRAPARSWSSGSGPLPGAPTPPRCWSCASPMPAACSPPTRPAAWAWSP